MFNNFFVVADAIGVIIMEHGYAVKNAISKFLGYIFNKTDVNPVLSNVIINAMGITINDTNTNLDR